MRENTTNDSYAAFYPVIAPLIMCSGIGDGKTTSCVMAQAATIDALRKGQTLDKPTDEMECACPVLRRLAIRLNDGNWWESDIERTNTLRPLIPMLLDSKGNEGLTERRIYTVADNCVRALTPMRLEWIARHHPKIREKCLEGAAKMRELSPIVDHDSAISARDICREFRRAAYAAAAAYAYAATAAAAYAYAATAAAADAAAAAYADAAADADAAAAAYAAVQRVKYRDCLLALFKEIAVMK